MHDPSNQKYMLARQLSSGVLVAETVVEGSPEPAATGSLFQAFSRRFLGTPLVPAPVMQVKHKTLYLPHGKEAKVVFLPVQILRDDVIRFCPVNKAVAEADFPGVEEPVMHDEGAVDVFTRNRIRGFFPGEYRKAVVRCHSDGRRLRATVEDLIPVDSN
ncbi:hypothetical protein FJZ28_01710 [Candidatus Peregrinibacteria bacterium]|nr:hypothetical protein [Candidatus Peregrinibacteria bacterium]